MDIERIALLGHLLAVFVFVAGYVGTNVLIEIARRAPSLEERRAALAMSGRFDIWLYRRGGTAVIVSGPIGSGHSALHHPPWVLASTALFLLSPCSAACIGRPSGSV